MRWSAVGAVTVCVGLFVPWSRARGGTVPEILSFQGRLTTPAGEPITDPALGITFRIYDDATSVAPVNLLWEDTLTVAVSEGVFSVLLGDTMTGGAALNLPFDAQYWLALQVSPDADEMDPRFKLAAAPYAIRAKHAETAGDAATLGGAPVGTADGNIVAVQPSGMLPVLDGSQLTGIDADTLDGMDSTDFAVAAAIADAAGTVNDPGNPLDWSQLKSVPAGFADGVDNGLVETIWYGLGLVVDSGDPANVGIVVDRTQFDGWYVETAELNSVDSAMIVNGSVTASDIDTSQVQVRVTGTAAVGQYIRAINENGTVTTDNSISGNAANVTGVVAVANGGTGATTDADARTNLGLGALSTLDAVAGGTAGTITDGTIADTDLAAGTFLNITGVGTLDSLTVSGAASLATTAGDVGIGTAAPSAKLEVTTNSGDCIRATSTAAAAVSCAVRGQSDSTSGYGVFGNASASSGTTYGVFGQAVSPDGRGVCGVNTSASGPAYGAYARSDSTGGRGVYGLASAGTGNTLGVYGASASDAGTGVYGWASSASGTTNGVSGNSPSTSGRGVFGYVTATTGTTYGVLGTSASSEGCGVRGAATSASGTTYGVYGSSASTEGRAVFGSATAASGNTTGVYGLCYSASGSAGVFTNTTSGLGLQVTNSGAGTDRIFVVANPGDVRFAVDSNGDVFADGTVQSPAADFAEMMPAVDGLAPADVLVIGADGRLARSATARAASVAGVHSTRPAFLGGSGDGLGTSGRIPLAVIGIVPTKVSAENGPIAPGDLLVTSDTPGHAMRDDSPRVGTVIGKALEAHRAGTGVIRVLVTQR